ncbi:MAG: metallophosphoesterase family protein [Lachnospiraceae bacterium]|nr:metallophosphoesterase family protein [Lachnospiraceae bacterium]
MNGHRIAVISDTHNLLRPEVAEVIKTCEVVLHGGDISGPQTLEMIRGACGGSVSSSASDSGSASGGSVCGGSSGSGKMSGSGASGQVGGAGNFYVVRGNNDRDWAADIPYTLEVTLFGRRFFMTHKKKDIPANVDADVVIYGHSHRYAQEYKDGTLFLNPGSCGPRRFNQAITMAVLTIPDPVGGDSEDSEQFSSGGGNLPLEGKSGERQGCYGITVEKIEIPHSPLKTSAAVTAKEQVSADLIRKIGSDLAKNRTVAEIAARRGVSRELTEQIVRLYVTHPGVTAEQIMSKMGL